MTIDAQPTKIPTQATAREVSEAETAEEAPLFVGAWEAHRGYAPQESTTPTVEVEVEAVAEAETETEDEDEDEQPGSGRRGIRQALAARYAVYRLNRRFRRNQREFDQVMDNIAHDPGGQRELQTSWTLRD